MLEVKHLSAGYGSIEVLSDISFEILPGEIVSIIGPNGAGKSTIFKSIFNLADISGGEIWYDNVDLRGLETHEVRGVGISYNPQGKINFGSLTVEENLLMGLSGSEGEGEARRMLGRIYGRFPVLGECAGKLAYQLSGGQQQILALCRSLIQEPSLLLLDEPSLGLSPMLQVEVFEAISRVGEGGMSVCIVEQNVKKAVEISDRVFLLDNHKITQISGGDAIDDGRLRDIYLGKQ